MTKHSQKNMDLWSKKLGVEKEIKESNINVRKSNQPFADVHLPPQTPLSQVPNPMPKKNKKTKKRPTPGIIPPAICRFLV